MKKYLLPCNCGQKVEIDATQAGLQVTCVCGARLDVPTMRGITQLAVVEPRPEEAVKAAASKTWGPSQGLLFLGGVIGACGLIALALVFQTRPHWMVHSEAIFSGIDQMSPAGVWERWLDLRKGLSGADDPVRLRFEADWATYRRRMTLAAIPAGLGALLLVTGGVWAIVGARPQAAVRSQQRP